MNPPDPKTVRSTDQGGLVVPLRVDERERFNEWAAEVGVPAAELARRLLLRYLTPAPQVRDAVDERIGETLLARAGAMSHIPAHAAAQVRRVIDDLKHADENPEG